MRRYLVTGIHPVLGHEPGTMFAALLPPQQERQLVDGGALRVQRPVKAPGKPAKPKET